jgi:predicted ribosome quality control (RQC) complex YloA/Tae2 family protein
MRFGLISQLVEHFQNFRHLHTIYRFDDTSFCIEFEKNNCYQIDLIRGESLIHPIDSCPTTKHYQAPFDNALSKRCNNTTIVATTLVNNDRIIRFELTRSNGYKIESTYLQIELTGRHVNMIIMDENHYVIEAFRHIDTSMSSRCVKVGSPLVDPPFREFQRYDLQEENINDKLKLLAQEKKSLALTRKKDALSHATRKLYDETISIKEHLPTAESLLTQSEEAQLKGHLLLANRDKLKIYDNSITLENFDGTKITINLPKVKTITQLPEYFFKHSKRLKQKAINIAIQHEHIEEKSHFLARLLRAIENASSLHDLSVLFPSKEFKRSKKGEQTGEWEIFLVEGYKIFVGKNKSGNATLLKNAKASDMWLHLKDRPSAHVIIPTQKTQLPQEVIMQAAKLCARFSVDFDGEYEVDHTQRRHVKPKENANCLYVNYKTIKVLIP